jgi:hypothetical protein
MEGSIEDGPMDGVPWRRCPGRGPAGVPLERVQKGGPSEGVPFRGSPVGGLIEGVP